MSSINRKPHVLRKEKTLTIPRHVIFVDTETRQTTAPDGLIYQQLILGWACYLRVGGYQRPDKKYWFQFTRPDEFWNFLAGVTTPKTKFWVIAHNLSFDFTILQGFKYLTEAAYKCSFFYSEGITTLIKVKRKGSSIMFVDSLNWFRESLEKLGERLGLVKLEIDFETADVESLSAYCHRDVEILILAFESLARFLTDNSISRLAPTIGSLAWSAYLFRHYKKPIYIHNNSQAIDLERSAYKGGRTECFYIGELNNGPYYVVDVNSLYPFVMRINLFPVKYEKIVHNLRLSRLKNYLRTRSVIAECIIETKEAIYAVRGERTVFPVGIFSVVLCSPEILRAIDQGHLRSVKVAVIYKRAKIFTSFVERFYTLRRKFIADDNKLFEHFCKILMNSLYGKFGQKAETWIKIGEAPGEIDRVEDCYDTVTHKRRKLRYLLGDVFEMTGFTESRHSFPGIAAHVTAYARLYLYDLLVLCGKGNYFYCDTDSLFINTRGLENLAGVMDRTEIGKLKIESVTSKLVIHGLKDYVTDTKTVIKGIRKNAVKISDRDYQQDKWPSLKGLLRGGSPNLYPVLTTTKHLYRDYTKGTVDSDGWIRPFVLDDPARQTEFEF